MSKKTINRLLVAIACLAAFYGLLIFLQYRQTAPGAAVRISTAGLSRSADRLVIRSDSRTASLVRRGEKWFVGKKPVGNIKISTLLQAIDKMVLVRVVTNKAGDLKTYGLTEAKSNFLKAYQGKKLLRAFYFGSMSDSNSYYVRTDRGLAVYEATGDLIFEVGQPSSGWGRAERVIK